MVKSKWDFDQVGHGGKKTIFFLTKIHGKKNRGFL
jgi:hypothetical protein